LLLHSYQFSMKLFYHYWMWYPSIIRLFTNIIYLHIADFWWPSW